MGTPSTTCIKSPIMCASSWLEKREHGAHTREIEIRAHLLGLIVPM